jgi:hypothetical protein
MFPRPKGERVRVRGDFQMKLKSFSFVPSVAPLLNPGFYEIVIFASAK